MSKYVDVTFTVDELKKIHSVIGKEIDRVNIYEANDLMKICKEIEKQTEEEIVWV